MNSECPLNKISSISQEVISFRCILVQVVCFSCSKHGGMVRRSWNEGISELTVSNSSIRVSVPSSNKHICVFFVDIHTKFRKRFNNFMSRDPTLSSSVKDLEHIHQVEIRFLCKLDFSIFKLLLKTYLLLEC